MLYKFVSIVLERSSFSFFSFVWLALKKEGIETNRPDMFPCVINIEKVLEEGKL
jgi:hypothetical protein